jgi:hypothetical protein
MKWKEEREYKFEVMEATSVQILVFCAATTCCIESGYQSFEGIFSIRLHVPPPLDLI